MLIGNDKNSIDIGKIVKINRKKSGMTQENLAEKLGLSTKYIQFIENNKRTPSMKVVFKIAEIFKTDACKLFCSKKIFRK